MRVVGTLGTLLGDIDHLWGVVRGQRDVLERVREMYGWQDKEGKWFQLVDNTLVPMAPISRPKKKKKSGV
jgi:hypothetical protein